MDALRAPSSFASLPFLPQTDALTYVLRRIDLQTSAVSTIAGRASVSGFSDGAGTQATFGLPTGVAMDAAGAVAVVVSLAVIRGLHHLAWSFDSLRRHMFVLQADYNGNAIRLVNLTTNVVTTIAGSAGVSGASDGVGTAAMFSRPMGVAMLGDAIGAVVADQGNARIRFINMSSLAVATMAGSSNGLADGAGTAAKFLAPVGCALDVPSGSIYVVRKWRKCCCGEPLTAYGSRLTGGHTCS